VGSAGSEGSQGTSSPAAGGATAPGAALPLPVVGAASTPTTGSSDADANAAAAAPPPPGLLEGSRFYLGTYGGQVPPASVGQVSFDQGSGMLSFSDVELPRIDAAAGASFRISPTGAIGQVDSSQGEVQMALPVDVVDQAGNTTSTVLQLTTGTATTTLPDGTELSVSGKPVTNGVAVLVATQAMESGPFQGMPVEAQFIVRVSPH